MEAEFGYWWTLAEAARDILDLFEEPEYEDAGMRFFDRTTCDSGLSIDALRDALNALPPLPVKGGEGE